MFHQVGSCLFRKRLTNVLMCHWLIAKQSLLKPPSRKCLTHDLIKKMPPFQIPDIFYLDLANECSRSMFSNNYNFNFLNNHLSQSQYEGAPNKPNCVIDCFGSTVDDHSIGYANDNNGFGEVLMHENWKLKKIQVYIHSIPEFSLSHHCLLPAQRRSKSKWFKKRSKKKWSDNNDQNYDMIRLWFEFWSFLRSFLILTILLSLQLCFRRDNKWMMSYLTCFFRDIRDNESLELEKLSINSH